MVVALWVINFSGLSLILSLQGPWDMLLLFKSHSLFTFIFVFQALKIGFSNFEFIAVNVTLVAYAKSKIYL